jgi:tRNA nucleotidyltransferase (CCA-adding enzyme)
MTLPEPLESVLRALGRRGRPFLVGGCVRDWLLGVEPKDFDVEVFGIDWPDLLAALSAFGPTDVVGQSFGVVKVRLNGAEYDISLPRRETKTGSGHRGFTVEADAALDEKSAAARRDFTINALFFDPASRQVVDHHGGLEDLRARVLRHTSDAFVEDPLRVLRGFQLAARFELTMHPATVGLCASIGEAYADLPRERVWGEWDKWATKSRKPSLGLAALKQTGWLRHFPELAALDGLPQEPEWHPEGDVFTHTGCCLDALVGLPEWGEAGTDLRRLLMFAVLCHDLGKAETTERSLRSGRVRLRSPGHDRAGGPLSAAFLERIGSPIDLRPGVRALVENHHAHYSWIEGNPIDSTVRRLARKLAPANLQQLALVMEADHLGRPPLASPETRDRIDRLRSVARRLSIEQRPPAPLLQGRDLIAFGSRPGPEFGRILRKAYEAQLEGAFSDHSSAVQWLRAFVGEVHHDRPAGN